MSSLQERFDDYCHDENTRACENCQYDDGNSDLIGCAMNFAYQKGREDAIDEFVAFANTMPTVEDADGYVRPMWLEEMAKQLKEKKA